MRYNGFTLIELMIVVAIIGILSTLAMPLYKHRVIRAQVVEAIELSGFAKESIIQYRIKTGFIPGDNLTAGLPDKDKIIGNYVKSVLIAGGAINIEFGNRVHKDIENKILSIRPAVVEGEKIVPIAWVCGNASVPTGMVVKGVNRTTLLNSELTIDCRL